MNKLMLTAAPVLFSLIFAANATDVPDTGNVDTVYCALLKSGKMMLVADGKHVFKVYLKNGECINYEGNIFDFSNIDNNKVKENNIKTL